MIVTPELDIRDSDFMRIFTQKKTYEVISQLNGQYELTNDLGFDILVDASLFVTCPDNILLDSRTPAQSRYDRLKQRDSDYHKVYKERMGIDVLTWQEEDYLRHKDEKTGTAGLPEGHAIDSKQEKKV